MRSGSRCFLAIVGVCAMLCTGAPARAASAPQLGSAASFAVLGGSAVANSGATRVVGNVGVSPGKAVSGFRPEDVSVGDIYLDDAVARRAQRDIGAVWDELARGPCIERTALAGTIGPGVYCVAPSAMPLSGVLTLTPDAGDAGAVWIFRMSSLTTAVSSSVITIGGQDRNVFWRVEGAATLGERTAFVGNILASSSITLKNGATLSGRALARNGAVTLDSNKVSACCEPITLVQTSLPDASVGATYRQKIDASGGAGEYTFAKISGSLPDGLTLSVDGIVSGAPVARGSYSITVMATDRNGCSGARAYTIVVGCASAILLSPDVLPGGMVGSEYHEIITATGGTGMYTFDADDATLPAGLDMTTTDAGTGLLSGTPTAAGIYTFTVTAEDTVTHCIGSKSYTVTIAPPPIICTLTIAPETLPNATLGMPYSVTLEPSGGSGSYVLTVTGLPDGLSPDGRTLTGIPTVACLHEVTVTVTDTITGCVTIRTYTLAVCPLTLSPFTLPGGTVGIEYPATTIRPDCGSELYTFEVTEPFPPGLTPPPEISGAPTTAGTYTFTVTGRDSTTGCTGSRTYIVKICPKITIRTSLPDGDVGVPYSETIVSGGTPDYTFVLLSGSFPPGLDPLPDGKLAGTPTAEGQFFVRIRVTDANGCSAEGEVEIEIDGPPPMAGPVVPLSAWAMTLLSVVLAVVGCFAIRRSL